MRKDANCPRGKVASEKTFPCQAMVDNKLSNTIQWKNIWSVWRIFTSKFLGFMEGTWDYWGYAARMWGHLAHGVWPDLGKVSPDVTPVYPQLISFLIVLARIGETRESNTEFALENEEHEVARRIRDAEDDTAGLPCALSRHKGGTKLEEKGRLAVG